MSSQAHDNDPFSMLDALSDGKAFEALVHRLGAAAATYYDSDTLLMTDAEYDAGVEIVKQAVTDHPEWVSPRVTYLLHAVAAGASAGGDVAHPAPMLSMAKATTLDEVDALVAKCGGGVVVEPKLDGLALRVEYRDGTLVLAATRGDGTTGEDVTAQVLRGSGVMGLPRMLEVPWTGEVRGEVFMLAEQFAEAQTLRAQRGGKPFVNPRNATAGALRKSGPLHWMPMTFAAYDLIPAEDTESTHTERMAEAEQLWFMTAGKLAREAGVSGGPYRDAAQVREAIAQLEDARPGLDFEIDGAVVKADLRADRDRLGARSNTPNWATAYKYLAEEASSVIEDIEVAIGRTGRISLRARIEPVFVGGTTVTYATLHNPAFIEEQKLNVGAKVVVKRAGDVIPRVTAALAGNEDLSPWEPPTGCPNCGGEWDKSSLLWRCHSPECSIAGRLEYWAERNCMDIEGVGAVVAEALAEAELAKDVADLYDLTEDQWAGLPLGKTETGATRTLGRANAQKILASLEETKSQPFNRVITGLGIRTTGRSVGRWLAAAFPTMARLRAASVEDIAQLEGLGPIKAKHIVDGLAQLGEVIDRLAAAGVNMGTEPAADEAPKPLAGKTYVVSGSVPGYTRTTVAERIEELGGKSSSSVSKNTTALVTAETGTSKAKKADQLGIPVIDPAEFVRMLDG